jgi:hypothetical protein
MSITHRPVHHHPSLVVSITPHPNTTMAMSRLTATSSTNTALSAAEPRYARRTTILDRNLTKGKNTEVSQHVYIVQVC